MFARKIRVQYADASRVIPCPLKWLDSFSMRNFTNASVFDDTLPVADGEMEIGSGVPLRPTQGFHGGLVPAQELPAQRLAPDTQRQVGIGRNFRARVGFLRSVWFRNGVFFDSFSERNGFFNAGRWKWQPVRRIAPLKFRHLGEGERWQTSCKAMRGGAS